MQPMPQQQQNRQSSYNDDVGAMGRRMRAMAMR
jgi:hypothetical protein